jgi:ADP-ribose pyrophosphatase
LVRDEEGDGLETVISSELIYKGKAVTLRRDVVEQPTGRRASREIIEHPGSVAIVPLLDGGERIVLVRQFRLATGGVMLEIPAGTLQRSEAPEQGARRELEEETGYVAAALEHLFDAFPTPGYSMEMTHYYLATGLEMRQQRTDEDEIIRVEVVEIEKAMSWIRSGELRDAKSIAAIAYLLASGKDSGDSR